MVIEIALALITITAIIGLIFIVERNAKRNDQSLKILVDALKAKDLNDLVTNRIIEKDEPKLEIPNDIPVEFMDDEQYIGAIKKQMNSPQEADNV